MCLARIEEFPPCKLGYKIMRRSPVSGKLYGEFKGLKKPRPIERWLNEEDYRDLRLKKITTNYPDSHYPCGWHVFHRLSCARRWLTERSDSVGAFVCVRVQVREPVATGLQRYNDDWRVTVAKKIKILEVLGSGSN